MSTIDPIVIIAIVGASSLGAVITTSVTLLRERAKPAEDRRGSTSEQVGTTSITTDRDRSKVAAENNDLGTDNTLPRRGRTREIITPALAAIAVIVVIGSVVVGDKYLSGKSSAAHPGISAVPEASLTYPGGQGISTVTFAPDGKVLATAAIAGGIYLWNTTKPASIVSRILPLSVQENISSVAFSPDGHILADGTSDGTIQMWNVATPARPKLISPRIILSNYPVLSLAFSPDGKTLGSGGDRLRLWDITDPAQPVLRNILPQGSSANVTSIAFSPNGRVVASADENGTIQLWDLAQLHKLLSLPAIPYGKVSSMTFSPNGTTLATGDLNGSAFLWNAANGRLITALPDPGHSGGISSVAFSPNGTTLATGDLNGSAFLWNAAEWSPGPAPSPTTVRPLSTPVVIYTSVPVADVLNPKTHTDALSAIIDDLNSRLTTIGRNHDKAALVLIFAATPPNQANKAILAASAVFGNLKIRDPVFASANGENLWTENSTGSFEFQIFFST